MVPKVMLVIGALGIPTAFVEIVTEGRLIDIITDGFDAGVNKAEAVPQDMIAVSLGPHTRHVVVGAPSYFANRPLPIAPAEMGPSNRQGASMRSLRKAARKVAVFHLPCGTLSTSRWPLGAQPRSLVMLVVQVSSMKTSRVGSMSP
jgi:hypothetical protein